MSSPSTGSFITDGTSVALPVISPDPIPVTATSGNTADEIQQAVLYQVDDPFPGGCWLFRTAWKRSYIRGRNDFIYEQW
jgi:hypothetical protein